MSKPTYEGLEASHARMVIERNEALNDLAAMRREQAEAEDCSECVRLRSHIDRLGREKREQAERIANLEAGRFGGDGLLPPGDAPVVEADGVAVLRERVLTLEAERDEFRGYLGAIVRLFDAGLAEYHQIPELVDRSLREATARAGRLQTERDEAKRAVECESQSFDAMREHSARMKQERDAQRRLVRMLRAEREAVQRWLVEDAEAPS